MTRGLETVNARGSQKLRTAFTPGYPSPPRLLRLSGRDSHPSMTSSQPILGPRLNPPCTVSISAFQDNMCEFISTPSNHASTATRRPYMFQWRGGGCCAMDRIVASGAGCAGNGLCTPPCCDQAPPTSNDQAAFTPREYAGGSQKHGTTRGVRSSSGSGRNDAHFGDLPDVGHLAALQCHVVHGVALVAQAPFQS
jgi:hypothetical protein